jgi:hypothetical protein
MLLVACSAVAGGTAADPSAEPVTPPVARLLSPHALEDRLAEIEQLLAGSDETRELDDGYEFRFPGDEVWAGRLLDLIQAERQCCQFLRFELSFEPQRGPIRFRVRGSEEIKAFLGAMMAD